MYEYEIRRSKRKTISLSVNHELKVIVKAPLKIPIRDIESFVNKHTHWIQKHMLIIEQRNKNRVELAEEQIEELKQKANALLPERVNYYSSIMGVNPTSLKITSAKTRWGSCSGKNSICFSYRLMLLPLKLIDYVVVHELAHIIVKNHSSAFYAVIFKYMPDYKARVAEIKRLQQTLPY